MIEDETNARKISELMLDYGARLDASVEAMQSTLPPNEFRSYRRVIGGVMAEMLLKIMNPIYQRHPSLKPPELK
jgi:hypothetical protein